MFSSVDNRAGLTIVECLVSLMLLAIGMLGSAGVVGASWRVMRTGNDAALAARRLLSIADSLAAVGDCGALVSGQATTGRVTLRWEAQATGDHVDIRLTSQHPVPFGTRTDTTHTAVSCAAA